jgi:peroxiredoxin
MYQDMRILKVLFFTAALSATLFGQQQLKSGQAAPDFVTQTMDGRPINLSDLQGKVVVLTFWSTRCAICVAEIPKLNQIVSRYKQKGVVFLALTMENNSKVEPFLRRNQFDFDIVPNSFGVVLKYADMDADGRINMGFPAYYLIGKSGKIELRDNGWDKTSKLESQISNLLTSG